MTNLKFMLYRAGLSCLLGLAVIGCSSAVETALDAEFKKMESLFQVDPGAGVRHGREIGVRICGISNEVVRTRCLAHFRETILSMSLTEVDYTSRDRQLSLFPKLQDVYLDVLWKCGPSFVGSLEFRLAFLNRLQNERVYPPSKSIPNIVRNWKGPCVSVLCASRDLYLKHLDFIYNHNLRQLEERFNAASAQLSPNDCTKIRQQIEALSGCRAELHGDMQCIERSFAKVSFDSSQGRTELDVRCGEIVSAIKGLDPQTRIKVLDTLGTRLRTLPIVERSYPARVDSLGRYGLFIMQLTERLRSIPGFEESAWRIRLEAIERINDELSRGEHDSHESADVDASMFFGPLMTQRQYKRILCAQRFELVRDGFEFGRFTVYFHALSQTKQQIWLSRLEAVAHRKVVIWNPDHPFAEMPQENQESRME